MCIIPFVFVLQSENILFFFFSFSFCSLCFWFLTILSIDPRVQKKFSAVLTLLKSPLKACFISVTVFLFPPLAFHFDSFLDFPLLCLHCSSVLTCCLLSLIPLSILVITVLKSSVTVSASCYVWFQCMLGPFKLHFMPFFYIMYLFSFFSKCIKHDVLQ